MGCNCGKKKEPVVVTPLPTPEPIKNENNG
jgi:hypothetical protein